MTEVDSLNQKIVVHRSWNEMPICERGEGIYVWDDKGNKYIDGSSGSSVITGIGHGVHSVIEAMSTQAKKVSYSASHIFSNKPMLELGQILYDYAPGDLKHNCRSWITVSGTDAVDDAVRLARQYWVSVGRASKYLIISRWRSFHGNNIGVAGFHGHTGRRSIYSPMYVNHPHIPPAYCYRCPFDATYPNCDLRCAHALETEINQQGEDNIAAFIAEPIVGAALGSVPPPDGYFEVIRDICDRHDVLFIADEVMTGWGRTGHWWGIESWNVTPDIIATAKGMGAGYAAIAATIGRNDLWQALEETGVVFTAGHTMNHNPVACAGAVAVIRYAQENNLFENAREIGVYMRERLEELLEFDIVGDVRGEGMMGGLEFVKDRETKEPFNPTMHVSRRYAEITLRRGLISYPCTGCVEGLAGDMALITPPLIINKDQIDDMIDIIKESLKVLQIELGNAQGSDG